MLRKAFAKFKRLTCWGGKGELSEYQELEEVKEYAETHFFNAKNLSELDGRTSHSQFWAELAAYMLSHATGDRSIPPGFLSEHFIQATRSFTELAVALTFLDLP